MISTYEVFFYGVLAIVLLPTFGVLVGLLWWLRLHREFAHLGRRMGVRWWDAAGPVVLATGIFVVVVLLGDIPDEGESGNLTFAFSGALLLVGVFGATLALGNLDEYRQIATGADSAGTVDEGPAVVSGAATANGEVLTGPLSGEPSLYHTLRITESRGIGHRKADAEIHFESEGVPFVVDDGAGAVQVDPTDGTVRLWRGGQLSADTTVSPDPGDGETPEPSRAFESESACHRVTARLSARCVSRPRPTSRFSERSVVTRRRATRSFATATAGWPSSRGR